MEVVDEGDLVEVDRRGNRQKLKVAYVERSIMH
jgi:hypothetical protein